jgi:hypothetical protein
MISKEAMNRIPNTLKKFHEERVRNNTIEDY